MCRVSNVVHLEGTPPSPVGVPDDNEDSGLNASSGEVNMETKLAVAEALGEGVERGGDGVGGGDVSCNLELAHLVSSYCWMYFSICD
jgi:hypothetical protein